MPNWTDLRWMVAAIWGISGVSHGMEYEPFPTCTESAQVDSLQETVFVDETLDPAQAPFTGTSHFKYVPGTCFLSQTIRYPYYLEGMAIKTDYRERTALLAYDFDLNTVPAGPDTTVGTMYYSSLGAVDSITFRSTHIKPGGIPDTAFGLFRYTRKPAYQLVEDLVRHGSATWTVIEKDSVVEDLSGKTIYTQGEDDEPYTTKCSLKGQTYECDQIREGMADPVAKDIWFLTQGRTDSLQHWSMGTLTASERYFWSSKSAAIRLVKGRGKPPATASLWNDFDLMGRMKAWRRTRF
ncbi:MAG: hypothetical protein JWO30_3912 [Fibrobacteres bacterium]|nr:hypothetical protein [Fibrobacterota bacterium]